MRILGKLVTTGTLGAALLLTAGAPALAASSSGSATTTAVKHKVVSRHHHKKVVKKKKVVHKPAAAVLSPFEAALLKDMNAARARAGVRPLVAEPGTTDVARRFALTLASQEQLAHNGDLVAQLQSAGSKSWTRIEENVGNGAADDEAGLFQAYLASPEHRANLMDPRVKVVGIGVVQVSGADGDVAWNVIDFTDNYATSYGKQRTHALPTVMTLQAACTALS